MFSAGFVGEKLIPRARDVLTDIFKSCVYAEQMLSPAPTKPVKVSEIYLSKEQINSPSPGNLLHVFVTHVRPPKKVLEDQLTQVTAQNTYTPFFNTITLHFSCVWKPVCDSLWVILTKPLTRCDSRDLNYKTYNLGTRKMYCVLHIGQNIFLT